MNIGENIRSFRKIKGLTQQELGKRMNMTQSAIGQFENNDVSLCMCTVEKIASALEITVVDLILGYKLSEELPKYHLSNISTDDLLAELKRRCSNGS